MTMIRATEIEIGIKGQRLTMRGSCPPTSDRAYGNEAEFELDLTLARELHRLLGKLIPLAEKGRATAEVVALTTERSA
jgi:hypothetical protein